MAEIAAMTPKTLFERDQRLSQRYDRLPWAGNAVSADIIRLCQLQVYAETLHDEITEQMTQLKDNGGEQ